MKLIKLALISVVVLFVIATLIGLLMPSVVVVSRAVDISEREDKILSEISNLNRWPNWIEGIRDNGFKLTTPDSTGVGAGAFVNGNDIRITRVTATTVESTWKSRKGFEQAAVLNLIPDATHTITTVHWSFTQHIKWYPWERLGSMMNDKILGPVMEKSLANLKVKIQK
jgi:hypothetical protein